MKYKNKRFALFTTIFVVIFIIFIIFFLYKTSQSLFFYYSSIYQKNILSPAHFQQIQNLCKPYNESNMVLDPKANGRLMHVFSVKDPIYSVLFQPDFIEKIRKLCGNSRLVPCLEIPIEYRKYLLGSNMMWHSDVQMLPNLQYECVITLENTSDSKTIAKNWCGLFTRELTTEPNSILIVRAKGVEHCVTTTTKGSRTILKFVFCEP